VNFAFSSFPGGGGETRCDGFDQKLHGDMLRELGVIQVRVYFDNVGADEPPLFANSTK
jgi:hypothetical protein